MDNKEFYKQVLGVIAPWEVVNVDTNIEQDRVNIYIKWPQGKPGICPKCDTAPFCVSEKEWPI